MKRFGRLLACLLLPSLLASAESVADAAALVNQGRYREAAAAYETLAARDPGNATLHHSLGLCYQAMGDFSRASSSLERAVALSSTPEVPAYSLALLHEALAQKESRAHHLTRARDAWRIVALRGTGNEARTAARHLERIEEELGGSR